MNHVSRVSWFCSHLKQPAEYVYHWVGGQSSWNTCSYYEAQINGALAVPSHPRPQDGKMQGFWEMAYLFKILKWLVKDPITERKEHGVNCACLTSLTHLSHGTVDQYQQSQMHMVWKKNQPRCLEKFEISNWKMCRKQFPVSEHVQHQEPGSVRALIHVTGITWPHPAISCLLDCWRLTRSCSNVCFLSLKLELKLCFAWLQMMGIKISMWPGLKNSQLIL